MSTNPQFHRVYASHEYDTFTFPKEILYNSDLTPESMKLLLILLDYGKRPNWQLRQTHLICISGYTYHCFNKSMKNLESAGFVQRKRFRINGKLSAYHYEFSSFPIFKELNKEKPSDNEFEPVAIFKCRKTSLENRDYTYSNNNNVLVETTNLGEEKASLVSSSFEKWEEIEDLPRISESQKRTLYKKYTREQITEALKTFDIESAGSVFAMLMTAIDEKWEPNAKKINITDESIKVYQQAEVFLSRLSSSLISIAIDAKNAYIYVGTAVSTYPLNDENFNENFSRDINNYTKRKK